MTDVRSKNVYSKPLYIHTTTPQPTGFARDGYCRSPPEDTGNHSVAGTVTQQFLDFSASRGNDLRKQVGLQPDQKWCLCARRWKEAYDARQHDTDPVVPRVFLHATAERALDVVGFKDLKRFAADPEASHPGNNPQDVSLKGPGSKMRESRDIGAQEPKA